MKDFPLVIEEPVYLLRLQLAEVVWRQQLLHPAPRRQLADRLAEVRHAARAAVGGAGRHRPHLPDPPGRRGRCRALRRAFRAAAASSIGTSCRRSPVRKSSSTATGRGSWLRAFSPSRRRATRRATASCSSRTAFSSPATTWIGTGTSSSFRPPRTTAGIRGRSRPSRWSGWRTIASSGCCPATARRCICPPTRCGSKSCAWPSRCGKGASV